MDRRMRTGKESDEARFEGSYQHRNDDVHHAEIVLRHGHRHAGQYQERNQNAEMNFERNRVSELVRIRV